MIRSLTRRLFATIFAIILIYGTNAELSANPLWNNGTFEPDDIEIISITAGSNPKIKWKLHDNYTGSGNPILVVQDVDGDTIDTHDISDKTAKDVNYIEAFSIGGVDDGIFFVYLSYPDDGVGHKIQVTNGTATIIQQYIAYLGMNPLLHLPAGDFFASLDASTQRGTPETANMVAISDTLVRAPLFPVSGQGAGVDVSETLPLVLQGQFQNSYVNGVAGPGFYLPYHMPVYIAADDQGTEITMRVYVPSMAKWITLRDSHDGSVDPIQGEFGFNDDAPIDGTLEGKYKIFKLAKIVDGTGTAVTDLDQATNVEITKLDGTLLTFELWDVEVSRGDNDTEFDSYARLTTITDRNDVDLITCTYASTTTGMPSTVTDRFGHAATFTYGATIAGEPALTSITFNGQTTTLTYANDFLNKITYPGGAEWTCTLAHDAAAQTHNLTIDSPFEGTLIWRLTEDFFLGRDANGTVIYNQPTSVFRSVSDANDDLLKGIYFSGSTSSDARIWTAGDRLALYTNDIYFRFLQYYTTWTMGDITQGWDAFTNLTLEDEYSKLVYPVEGGTESELAYGAPTTIVTGNYTNINCSYDNNRYQTNRMYEDGSNEAWTYNAFGQVTRSQDRDKNVVKYEYDANGNLTKVKVGIKSGGIGDINQPEYAEYTFDYFSDGSLKTAYSPRWTSETDIYRTDYTYYANGQLKEIIEPAHSTGLSRPTTTFTYNTWGKVATVTDPVSDVTTFTYDNLGRRTEVSYPDGTKSKVYFAGLGSEGMPEKIRGPDGTVTKLIYDAEGRVEEVIAGYSTIDNLDVETVNNDVLTQSKTKYTYNAASDVVLNVITNGKKVSYTYDYKLRPQSTISYSGNDTLFNAIVYDGNRVFYTEDPYGRRTYFGYELNTNAKIRTVSYLIPGQSLADNDAVLALTRDQADNATYVIVDWIKDFANNKIQIVDARDIISEQLIDSRGRTYRSLAAVGTGEEIKAEYDFDEASNLVEVRSPRYFDSSDTNGYNYSKTTLAYDGADFNSSTTYAPGTAIAATESVAYNLDGTVEKTTDARSFDWNAFWNYANMQGASDPAGHGLIVNTDDGDRIVHSAIVEDYSTHANKLNPTDAKTLAESTASFDILGRPVAMTKWLAARGLIDPNDPPIAGLGGIAKNDGSTTQIIYDTNLADGVGLDHATGVTVNKLGGGTFDVSLANCLTQLADTTANGGGALSFTNDVSAGSGVVMISAEEEIAVAIVDALGRIVMQASIEPYDGTTPNALITWACVKYDQTVTVTGYGDCVETWSIDPNGKIAKARVDGAGRVIETEDREASVSTAKYDANGNIVEVRDPNGIGFDADYDLFNRITSRWDTWDSTVSVDYQYNDAGQVTKIYDPKGKFNTVTYDAIGRRIKDTDRMSFDTTYTYDANNNLLTVTDAENKTTTYEYNNRNLRLKITYPDHTGGNPGDSGYGIVEFSFDAAGRLSLRTDQLGETVTLNYDLAGRMTGRDYRSKANSPTGTISDSTTFTHDLAGRILTADSGRYNNTVTLTYDLAGRIDSESLAVGVQNYTTNYEYNTLSQLKKSTYPSGTTVERTYTDRRRLKEVKYAGNVVDTRTYDIGNRLDTVTHGNALVTNIDYRVNGSNKDNMISQVSTGNVGTYAYDYDTNKNRTKETITGNPITGYSIDTTLGTDPDGYDDGDRITYAKRSDNNKTQQWSLSNVADWNTLTENGTPTTRSHDNMHAISTIGAATMSYDVKGNLISDGVKGNDYTWDFDNQMIDADTDGDQVPDVAFEYDAFGRRVAKGNTVYAYSGQQVVAEYASGAAPTSPAEQYAYGAYIDEPILKDGTGGILFYARNKQYSVTALTDSTGAVVERYGYSTFGELQMFNGAGTPIGSSAYNNEYTFTSRRHDGETGIFYFRARYYDAQQGRFIERDPLGYIDGMSMYRGYFAPQHLDPTGAWQENEHKLRKPITVPDDMVDEFEADGTIDDMVKTRDGQRTTPVINPVSEPKKLKWNPNEGILAVEMPYKVGQGPKPRKKNQRKDWWEPQTKAGIFGIMTDGKDDLIDQLNQTGRVVGGIIGDGIGSLPWIGPLYMGYEVLTGTNTITGEPLSQGEINSRIFWIVFQVGTLGTGGALLGSVKLVKWIGRGKKAGNAGRNGGKLVPKRTRIPPADDTFAPGSLGAAARWPSKGEYFRHLRLPYKQGKIRFIPPEGWRLNQPLRRGKNGGFLDKFGNEWTKGPSRTAGDLWEWDVQLGPNATPGMKAMARRTTGKGYVNVSWGGHITH